VNRLRGAVFWYLLFGLAGVLLVALALWLLLGEGEPSAEELAERALNAPTTEERQEAAIELARCGKESVQLLRRVFSESDTPEVRAAIAQGLGRQRDVESLPDLIDAMEDASPLVRGRAGVAVRRIVGLEVPFGADAPPEERRKAVAFYRKFWEDAQAPDSKFIEYMKDPAKAAESAEKANAAWRARQPKEQRP
jgi:HEAT repeat protein